MYEMNVTLTSYIMQNTRAYDLSYLSHTSNM